MNERYIEMIDKTPQCKMHEALMSVLYDEATPQETANVRAHLAECSSCRCEFDEFEQVRGMLRQWQLDEAPVVRLATQPPRRSSVEILKELLGLPVWIKSLGVAAAALLVFAASGTEVSITRDGFTLKANLFRAGGSDQHQPPLSQSELKAMVREMIAQSAAGQKSELQAELARIESDLQTAHSSDLARLSASIKQYRARLDTLERDIDRREGLDLADILIGGPGPERSGSSDGAGSGE
jgi:hypothetical protein